MRMRNRKAYKRSAGLAVFLLSVFLMIIPVMAEGDDYPDTFETAKAIAFNTPVGGMIDEYGDKDIMSFTTDGGNNAYVVNVSALDTESMYVEIFDEFYGSGNTIDGGSFTAASGKTTSKGFVTLEKNKAYYIRISSRYGEGSKWRLLVSKIADDAGNDFAAAKKISVNKKVKGKFEVNDDIDFFTFKTPKKAKSYWIDIHNMTGSSQMMFVIYSRFSDLSSKIGPETQVYAAHNVEQTFKLSPNKTYYIKIYGGMQDTAYSIQVNQSSKTIKKKNQKPANFNVESNYSKSVYISFENNRRYDGVELWRSTSKSSGFKKFKVFGNEYFDLDDTKTKKKVTYYYKARYFIKEGSKKVYGPFTKVKGGKHKY